MIYPVNVNCQRAIDMSVIARMFTWLIKGYQLLLSPYFGGQCRFTPTCSDYALAAIAKHGAVQGGLFSGWRLLRCHPWCQGGYDPVP